MTTTEQITRAKQLVELLEAQERGETVQYETDGNWVDTVAGVFQQRIAFFLTGEDDFRVKPKPAPSIPDGLFWISWPDKIDRVAYLVTRVEQAQRRVLAGSLVIDLRDAERFVWSHDRKSWYNFYGEAVAS